MEIFHVVNRGVDKKKVFLDERDYFRFIHDMFEFNDLDSSNTTHYLFNRRYNDVGRRSNIEFNKVRAKKPKPRELLVNILAFCLMPNHYHLLLMPKVKDGVPLFMKKLNGGYAKYFNAKHERRGALFEGKYKRIVVRNEAHFIHLPYYIHLNPLDLIMPEWRERELKSHKRAIGFLENYRWSSHLDYLGKKNIPSVTQREFLLDFFDGHGGYRRSLEDWLKELDIGAMRELILE